MDRACCRIAQLDALPRNLATTSLAFCHSALRHIVARGVLPSWQNRCACRATRLLWEGPEMTRQIFGAVLLAWIGWQPLLAQDTGGRQSSPGATQANSNDQQTPAVGSTATGSARPAESGPALPAPDGSTSGSNASAPKAQQEQSIVANSDGQTQASNNAQQPRNDRSVTTVGDERRDETRGVRNNYADRGSARDYRHPELPEPIQPEPADRERSYLTHA